MTIAAWFAGWLERWRIRDVSEYDSDIFVYGVGFDGIAVMNNPFGYNPFQLYYLVVWKSASPQMNFEASVPFRDLLM